MHHFTRIVAATAVAAAGLSLLGAQGASAQAPPCAETTLVVVAHQDDDLLFMNPDIQNDLSAGKCVTTVFLTAGDAGRGETYWAERELAPAAAYATMLGTDDPTSWPTTTRSFAGHDVHTVTSTDGKVTLLSLRLPDGDIYGAGFNASNGASLQKLWEKNLTSLDTVDHSATYSRPGLVDTLREIAASAAPTKIRIQNDRTSSHDHSDHRTGAMFAREALTGYAPLIDAYLGYSATVDNLAPNVFEPELGAKNKAIESYAKHDPLLCLTGANCPTPKWSSRRYLVPTPANSTVVPGPAPYAGPNLARNAAVSASSAAPDQEATKAIDAIVDGYRPTQSTGPNAYKAEWATRQELSGAWLQLKWDGAQSIDRVYLYDRPNPNDNVTGGQLTFSDGTTVAVPALKDDGTATIVTFPRRSTTSVVFTVTSVSASTRSVGLAEIEAYRGSPTSPANTTGPAVRKKVQDIRAKLEIPKAQSR